MDLLAFTVAGSLARVDTESPRCVFLVCEKCWDFTLPQQRSTKHSQFKSIQGQDHLGEQLGWYVPMHRPQVPA